MQNWPPPKLPFWKVEVNCIPGYCCVVEAKDSRAAKAIALREFRRDRDTHVNTKHHLGSVSVKEVKLPLVITYG